MNAQKQGTKANEKRREKITSARKQKRYHVQFSTEGIKRDEWNKLFEIFGRSLLLWRPLEEHCNNRHVTLFSFNDWSEEAVKLDADQHINEARKQWGLGADWPYAYTVVEHYGIEGEWREI